RSEDRGFNYEPIFDCLQKEMYAFFLSPCLLLTLFDLLTLMLLNRFIHCLSRLAQKGRAVLRLPLLHKLIYNNV
ncbi:hypothetical protein, partial [Parabacteroides sp.]|uniref:hypothetical protein n=1 Tax=Parabacteroides sp. TaxID=1869337 RepID=UPI00257CE981